MVRIYGVAHCGNYGVMNRKKYATEIRDEEDGLNLQKEDWRKIGEYIRGSAV